MIISVSINYELLTVIMMCTGHPNILAPSDLLAYSLSVLRFFGGLSNVLFGNVISFFLQVVKIKIYVIVLLCQFCFD